MGHDGAVWWYGCSQIWMHLLVFCWTNVKGGIFAVFPIPFFGNSPVIFLIFPSQYFLMNPALLQKIFVKYYLSKCHHPSLFPGNCWSPQSHYLLQRVYNRYTLNHYYSEKNLISIHYSFTNIITSLHVRYWVTITLIVYIYNVSTLMYFNTTIISFHIRRWTVITLSSYACILITLFYFISTTSITFGMFIYT